MPRAHYDSHQLDELVLQMLETELASAQVYRAAMACATHPDLKKEWQRHLKDTEARLGQARSLCDALGLHPDAPTPARAVLRQLGDGLVQAMELAQRTTDAHTAQRVACDCVLQAETRRHGLWELLGCVAKVATGDVGQTLKAAHKTAEKAEHHHRHPTRSWQRELALQAVGLPAVVPPPSEHPFAARPASSAARVTVH